MRLALLEKRLAFKEEIEGLEIKLDELAHSAASVQSASVQSLKISQGQLYTALTAQRAAPGMVATLHQTAESANGT